MRQTGRILAGLIAAIAPLITGACGEGGGDLIKCSEISEEASVEAYSEVISSNLPDTMITVGAYACLGKELYLQGRYEEAVQAYTDAMELQGLGHDLYVLVDILYRDEKALEALQENTSICFRLVCNFLKGKYQHLCPQVKGKIR